MYTTISMDQNSTSTLKLLFCLESLNIKEHHYFVYFILAFSKMDQMNADQTSEKPTLQEGVNYASFRANTRTRSSSSSATTRTSSRSSTRMCSIFFASFPRAKPAPKSRGTFFIQLPAAKYLTPVRAGELAPNSGKLTRP